MVQVMDILKVAHRGGIEPSMDLLFEKGQQIPGSIQYNIRRYYAQHPWVAEDTGMLVTDGNKMEAIGSGLVMIVDGHDIRHSNIADIPDGNPISIENLKVHFCEKGNGYLVNERLFLPEVNEGAVVKKQVYVE